MTPTPPPSCGEAGTAPRSEVISVQPPLWTVDQRSQAGDAPRQPGSAKAMGPKATAARLVLGSWSAPRAPRPSTGAAVQSGADQRLGAGAPRPLNPAWRRWLPRPPGAAARTSVELSRRFLREQNGPAVPSRAVTGPPLSRPPSPAAGSRCRRAWAGTVRRRRLEDRLPRVSTPRVSLRNRREATWPQS